MLPTEIPLLQQLGILKYWEFWNTENSEISIPSPLLAVTAVLEVPATPAASQHLCDGSGRSFGHLWFIFGWRREVGTPGWFFHPSSSLWGHILLGTGWNSLGWDCLFALSMIFQLSGNQGSALAGVFPPRPMWDPQKVSDTLGMWEEDPGLPWVKFSHFCQH